jgi:cytochrome c oxidase subunit 1
VSATIVDTPAAATAERPGFRTCPITGRRIHRPAELLIRVNAVASILALLVGVIAAIGLVLTRWPAVHLLPAAWFYRVLTAHGLSMLIFFIIFFEMAVLHFAGPVLLNSRVAAPRTAWAGFGLMAGGALLTEAMVWGGKADVLMTSYVPLRAHPLFYLGIILFAVGALVQTGIFFASLVVAKRERTYAGSVPLVTYGAVTAAIIAVITLLHGAAVYVPTFLWSIGVIPSVDPEVYRMLWWALGHSSQQINVAAMVAIWYLLGALTVGAVVLNEKISRTAFVLYILFISMASAHHLLVDPGFSPGWKIVNTSYFMYMAVLASMLHGFTVPASIELGQRLRGFTDGMFGWLKRAPWGDPGFSAMIFSIVIFGFIGGITGVTFGTEQINIIAHNTLRIPGHFHATVVAGTALAFMGVTYYLIPLVFRKQVAFWRLARWQPWLFAGGMVVFTMAMTFAGTFGAPRRHWDITFSQAPFDVEYHPAVNVMLGFVALGGLTAAASVLSYILITVWSVLLGKPFLAGAPLARGYGVPGGLLKPPRHAPDVDERNAALHGPERGLLGVTPGTVALVFIFLAAFALYYFTNWKLLSFVWKIG